MGPTQTPVFRQFANALFANFCRSASEPLDRKSTLVSEQEYCWALAWGAIAVLTVQMTTRFLSMLNSTWTTIGSVSSGSSVRRTSSISPRRLLWAESCRSRTLGMDGASVLCRPVAIRSVLRFAIEASADPLAAHRSRGSPWLMRSAHRCLLKMMEQRPGRARRVAPECSVSPWRRMTARPRSRQATAPAWRLHARSAPRK